MNTGTFMVVMVGAGGMVGMFRMVKVTVMVRMAEMYGVGGRVWLIRPGGLDPFLTELFSTRCCSWSSASSTERRLLQVKSGSEGVQARL